LRLISHIATSAITVLSTIGLAVVRMVSILGRAQAQVEALTGQMAKVEAEIARRAEVLQIGRLEAHRDQLVEEIAELERQRGEFDD
jgi:DNA-binding helix-hairpin-helix protein with protein kinase domain